MRRLFLIGLIFISNYVLGQTTVFSDNFNTSQGETFTTSGAIGVSDWTVNRSGDDWGARIHNNILELTNDASAAGNANGWVFTYAVTSDFEATFDNTLSSNSDVVNYIFNMRQIRDNPSGFSSSNNYGVAFIIGSSSTNIRDAGNGYAVVLGNGAVADPDPIRFVRFTNGIKNIEATADGLIVATAPLDDIGSEYLSLALSYDPTTNEWNLYGRNDGGSFGDPADEGLTLLGTVVDDTYTSTALDYMGAYWQGSTAANQTSFFDNVSVVVGAVPLPVELTSFSAEYANNSVQLNWETATEVNNFGFDIERQYQVSSSEYQEWERIGLVYGHGTTNSPKYYSYIDEDLPNADKLFYRLKQIDNDGTYAYSKTVEVDLSDVTSVDEENMQYEFALEQNYPNPFNPVTTINFTIPNVVDANFASTSNAVLKVYNLLGQEIRTLVNEVKQAGSYQIQFDASDLPSGIYFYSLTYGKHIQTRKLALLK